MKRMFVFYREHYKYSGNY